MISIIIRTLILYTVLTLGIRLMGKRQIGDMQPNELVVTLVISEIAAIPLQDSNQPVLNGICSIFVLVVLEISLSALAMKNMAVRRLMSGQSVIIIENGKIVQSAMKKVRMTILDLVELLRSQDVFDINDVAFAVLEVNGDLSVLLKAHKQTLTPKDIDLTPKPATLPFPIISDGKVLKETCKAFDISNKELMLYLERERIKMNDIFLMTIDKDKKYEIIRKSDK
ncbi:MAG: DUF421 domain-containing protein [Clostridia bacterium]|nr:DUF421 domain-containing protein [Clostridia bacterium]